MYAPRKLEELAADEPYAIVGGPFGSKLTSADYVETGIPVIRGTNLNGGRYLTETDFVYVTEQKAREDLFGNLAHPGDIVFTQRGTLGQVALIPVDARFDTYIVSQSQMKMTVDPHKADPRFIYYCFSSQDTVKKIINQNASSGVPHINLAVLRNFTILLPELNAQQRIADFLAPYDDLIDNNRRRIALLENAARLLYREWFVYLRFPGHQHSRIKDGVPEGWMQKSLGSVLNLQRGFDLPQNDRVSGDIPVYGSTGIVGTHNASRVSAPTLITGRSGSLGSVCYVDQPCWPLNTALWLTEVKDTSIYFAYHLLQELNLAKFNSGASVPTLDRKVVHAQSVVIPPQPLVGLFDEQVKHLFAQSKTLLRQNEQLTQARDLLLPRLMNGEIKV